MQSDDLTIQVLIEIRDQIGQTNQRIDQTNARLDRAIDELGGRIDETNRCIVDSELRTATAIHQLAGTVRDVHTLLRDPLDLRDRVATCEREVDALKQRVG